MGLSKSYINRIQKLSGLIVENNEEQFLNKLLLSDEEIKILKEALLSAEVSRDKQYNGAGEIFKNLHIKIDEQLSQNF